MRIWFAAGMTDGKILSLTLSKCSRNPSRTSLSARSAIWFLISPSSIGMSEMSRNPARVSVDWYLSAARHTRCCSLGVKITVASDMNMKHSGKGKPAKGFGFRGGTRCFEHLVAPVGSSKPLSRRGGRHCIPGWLPSQTSSLHPSVLAGNTMQSQPCQKEYLTQRVEISRVTSENFKLPIVPYRYYST